MRMSLMGALDSKNAKLLMQKLSDLNREQKATILMVTHDANVASYCSRILFIQDSKTGGRQPWNPDRDPGTEYRWI